MKVTVDRELLERALNVCMDAYMSTLGPKSAVAHYKKTTEYLRAALASPAPDKLTDDSANFDNCRAETKCRRWCGNAACECYEAAIAKQPTEPGWLPISQAPKDGTEILLTNGVDVSSGQWFPGDCGTCDSDGAPNGDWHDACWLDWSGGMQPDPTHFRPLPEPPKDQA